MPRIGRKGTISHASFNKLRRVKGPLELFFISTDKGVVESCAQSSAGGLPLFLIK